MPKRHNGHMAGRRGGTVGAYLDVQRTAPDSVGIAATGKNVLTEAYGCRILFQAMGSRRGRRW